jgi:hypothetical protein
VHKWLKSKLINPPILEEQREVEMMKVREAEADQLLDSYLLTEA